MASEQDDGRAGRGRHASIDNGDAVSGGDAQPRTRPLTQPPPLPPNTGGHTGPPTRPMRPQSQPAPKDPRTSGSSKRAQRRASALRSCCLVPARVCGRGLAIVIPLALLSVGLVYLKLLFSPISLGFLVGPIEQGLNDDQGAYAFRIEDAILQRSQSGGIEFRLKTLRISDKSGLTVAVAALAGVELSPRGLISGRLVPSRIELIQPRISLGYDDRGRIAVRVSGEGGIAQRASGVLPNPTSKDPLPSDGDRPGDEPTQRIDVARVLADTLARMRHSGQATSYLESIGLRDAAVAVADGGHQAVWRVPVLNVHFEHKQKRSIIGGVASVDSGGGSDPWMLEFRVEESEKNRSIVLETKVSGLQPSALVRNLPRLGILKGIDAPVSATGMIDLSTDGEVTTAKLAIEAGRGPISMDWAANAPVMIEKAHLDLTYAGDSRRIDIETFSISTDRSNIDLQGVVEPVANGGWKYALRSTGGVLGGPTPSDKGIGLDSLEAQGTISPSFDRVELSQFKIRAGEAQVAISGLYEDAVGKSRGRLDGRISPMSFAALKALWPANLATRARRVVLERVRNGSLRGGAFRVEAGEAPGRQVSVTLEAADLEIETHGQLPPVEIPKALLRVEGTNLELTVPDATMTGAGNRKLAFKGGRLTVADIDAERPSAEFVARAQAVAATGIEMLERSGLASLKGLPVPTTNIDGKIDAQVRVTMPLGTNISMADARFDGKLKLIDGRVKDVVAGKDITAATVNVDFTERAIETRGDLIFSGVLVKLAHQWLVEPVDGKQPPLRLTSRLDGSDRVQLGMDLEHIVQGEVPIEILVERTGEQTTVRLVGDLTGAELRLDDLHWRKPSGSAARLSFDVGKARTGKGLELQNFKLSGESIALEGWVGLGPDNKARQYEFPEFSLNVITNLDVKGTFRPDRVWEVTARGKTFDARDTFRSLMSFDQEAAKPVPKDRPGLDLTAIIDTALGENDTTLRQVTVKMQTRQERLVMLDLKGTLENGKPLTATLRQDAAKVRRFHAETADAGQAFKLIGLYSSMVGGSGTLDMALDGGGAADKSGQLNAKKFSVLGDTVVAEVLQGADDGRPAIENSKRSGRRVVREQFEFDRMTASFSLGNRQVALENAVVTGPMIGATLRGKLDYKTQRMQLGGTYVPLSALNRAVGQIPLFGVLLAGPKGEGVFGITFAIEGQMSEPQVIVNPLSLVTPGITREIFQMVPENPRITPQSEPAPKKPRGEGPQLRSSPPSASGRGSGAGSAEPVIVDGWSATEQKPAQKR